MLDSCRRHVFDDRNVGGCCLDTLELGGVSPWSSGFMCVLALLPVWYYDLGLIFLSYSLWLLSACSMARGQEETSTSQDGRRRGSSRGTPFTSSVISSLFIEELRSYCQIPSDIDFELSDGPTESNLVQENNTVYFTREQLAVGLHFPVLSLVKKFLHFTRAPPSCFQPNVVDSDWMLCIEFSIPAGHFLGGVLFYLYFEVGAWRSVIHVGTQPPATIHYWTSQFAQDQGEECDPGQGTLV